MVVLEVRMPVEEKTLGLSIAPPPKLMSVDIWTLYLPLVFEPEETNMVMELVETNVMLELAMTGQVHVDMTGVYPEAPKSSVDPALFQRARARMK